MITINSCVDIHPNGAHTVAEHTLKTPEEQVSWESLLERVEIEVEHLDSMFSRLTNDRPDAADFRKWVLRIPSQPGRRPQLDTEVREFLLAPWTPGKELGYIVVNKSNRRHLPIFS